LISEREIGKRRGKPWNKKYLRKIPGSVAVVCISCNPVLQLANISYNRQTDNS
jgi:hypothetical protein